MSGETFDVVVTRRFDAPVELLWNAWTKPDQVMRWWGPGHRRHAAWHPAWRAARGDPQIGR